MAIMPGQLSDLSEVRADDAHGPRRQIGQASLLSLLVKHLLQVVDRADVEARAMGLEGRGVSHH